MGKNLKGKEIGVGLSQRQDKKYSARFVSKSGKRVEKYFNKLSEAKQWLINAKYEDAHSNLSASNNMTVDSWFQYWIDIKEKTVRPNTVRNYRDRYTKNIQPLIGDMILSDLKTIHCQNIMNKMAEKPYRTSTIYQARICLYNMLDYALQNEMIQKNPCSKAVKSDIGIPSRKKEALTLGEHKAFLSIIKGNSYELQFRFALQTGLRCGELVGLKWGDIDFKEKTLSISRTLEYRHSTQEWREGEPKSKSGYRLIPLTEEAINILNLQKEKNKTIGVLPQWREQVFVCRTGSPIKNSTYDTALFKLCDRAKIKRFSMHILRHTFATRCIEAGIKPKTLQSILGHSNIGITMNLYVHTTDDEKKKEIEKLESYDIFA